MNRNIRLLSPFLIVFLFFSCKENGSNDTAVKLYLKGKEAYQKQELDRAEKLFKEALSADKSLTNAGLMLAKVYYHKKKFSDALDILNTILNNNEDHVNSLYWKSRILVLAPDNDPEKSKKDEKNAIKYLNRILEIDSSHLPSRLLLALLYEKNKLYKEAIYEYKSALREQETLVNARANLSVLYKRLGLREKSLEEIETAIKIADSARIPSQNLSVMKGEIK